MTGAANLTIKMLAASEAELLEHNASLQADVKTYRELVQVSLQQTIERDALIARQRKQLEFQREQIRSLTVQLRFHRSNASSEAA